MCGDISPVGLGKRTATECQEDPSILHRWWSMRSRSAARAPSKIVCLTVPFNITFTGTTPAFHTDQPAYRFCAICRLKSFLFSLTALFQIVTARLGYGSKTLSRAAQLAERDHARHQIQPSALFKRRRLRVA